MKEKGFWTRPRPYLDIGFKVAIGVTIVLVREWRYALVLLCIVGFGVLLALLMKFLRRKDDRLTITDIR
jgi:hypothetical protein